MEWREEGGDQLPQSNMRTHEALERRGIKARATSLHRPHTCRVCTYLHGTYIYMDSGCV